MVSHTDATTLNSLWYNYLSPTPIRYNVIFVAKVSCKLDFQSFPFDNHECDLLLRNWNGASYWIVLKSPTIYGLDDNGNDIEGKHFNITMTGNNKLDYRFRFESLPTTEYQDNGLKYSETGIKMIFKELRKAKLKYLEDIMKQQQFFQYCPWFHFSSNQKLFQGEWKCWLYCTWYRSTGTVK